MSNSLSNPFKSLKLLLDQIPLVSVSEKTVVLNVPWIWKDEIERQLMYLNWWLDKNKEIIKKWEEFYYSWVWKCEKLYPNDIEKQNQCKQLYAKALKVQKFVQSIQKNIEILEKYRNLPLQLYQYVHLVDFYVSQVICILNKYLDSIVGWLNRNSLIFEKWVDAIITIINTIKTWQILIDISVNWKTTCWKCRADNGDLYDCTLSGLCPDLPVLPIPPFKIPDIFIDLSHINLGLTVVLPKIKINPIPIGLFTLPDLPYPSLSIEIPSVPLLPEPPTFPPLPGLPAVPTFELPNLPPPPLIPKFMPSLKGALNVFKIVWYFRCIIKNWIWLVAEWNVKSRIEQLTARTNRLFPFDFLTIDFPVLPWKGFDVKVDSYLNYNVRFDEVYQIVKSIVEPINKSTTKTADNFLKFNMEWNQKSSEYNNSIYNLEIKPGAFRFDNWKIPTKYAKAYLAYQLNYLLSQQNANYLKSIPSYVYKQAYNILASLNSTKVSPNYKWIEKLRNKIDMLFAEYKANLEKLEDNIKNIWSGSVSHIVLTDVKKYQDKTYTFSTNLFNIDNQSKKKIEKANIKKDYLQMYGKVLTKFSNKLAKYEKKPGKYLVYKQLKLKVDKTLMLLNKNWGNYKIAFDSPAWTNPVMVDPTQFIRGLYVKGSDWTYYNVLADKDKAYKIRQSKSYILADLNNDDHTDLIWWDSYNVYVKYSWDKPANQWINYTQTYIYDGIVSNFANITDNNWYVKINDSEFKIWDKKLPIDDVNSDWWNYDNLSLRWSNLSNVNAYYILYSSRVDVLNDLEKHFNNSYDFDWAGENYKTYGIVLYDSSLGKIDEFKAQKILINGHKSQFIVYVPVKNLKSRKDIIAVLDKKYLNLQWRWKYFRVFNANLNLENNTLNVLSSYSNQDVGWEQLIWDNQAPVIKITLMRNEVKKVWEWTQLEGYINTHYTLIAKAKDNVAVKYFAITDENYNVLTTWNFIKLFEQQPITRHFNIISVDWNDNKQILPVEIRFKVPKITISKVDYKNWQVVAKISSDMDISAVKFYIDKNWQIIPLKSIIWKQIFTGWTSEVIFTWAVFKPNNTITLYDKSWNPIGTIDLNTSIISVLDYYNVYGFSSGGLLINKVWKFENWIFKPLFSIYIPSEKLVSGPTLYNSSKFDIKQFTWANLGEFSNSYCIFDKQYKTCAVYINKKGAIYIDPNYNFIATYHPNELWNVEYTFYDVSLPSLINTSHKIFSVIIKPGKIIKK